MIGNAMTGLLTAILGFFHIAIPEWSVQLAVIAVLLFTIFKWGKYISRILLVILLFVLGSILVNALLV